MSQAEPVIASAVPTRWVLLLKRSPWYTIGAWEACRNLA
jgi:hypothetical protein